MIGDSITAHAGGWCPHYWTNGLAGAPLQWLTNSGFNGQNILGLVSQIDNNYAPTSGGGGFAGLPPLDVAFVRIGTNAATEPAGDGHPIDSTNQTNYLNLIAKAKGYAAKVILLPVPPIGGAGAVAKNTAVPGYNAFLQDTIAGDSSGQLFWLDDCSDLTDGSGNVIPEFFISDELHPSPGGTLQMGITGYPRLLSILGGTYISPLVTDAADVYPAQPQWNPNPTNVGAGGTFGSGWSGTCPNGMTVANNGSGGAGTVSIVASDDANPVPWVRITPTTAANACNVSISFPGAGRTIDVDEPYTLEQLIEVRFNNLARFSGINAWAQAGGARFTEIAKLGWHPTLGVNRRATLQQKFRRAYPDSSSGSTSTCYVYLGGNTDNFSGDMGSFDFRCFSIRG